MNNIKNLLRCGKYQKVAIQERYLVIYVYLLKVSNIEWIHQIMHNLTKSEIPWFFSNSIFPKIMNFTDNTE